MPANQAMDAGFEHGRHYSTRSGCLALQGWFVEENTFFGRGQHSDSVSKYSGLRGARELPRHVGPTTPGARSPLWSCVMSPRLETAIAACETTWRRALPLHCTMRLSSGKTASRCLAATAPNCWNSLRLFANLFSGTLSCQSLLHPALLARLQVEGVTLHFLDDVFGYNLALEATKGVLQRLALLQSNFCQAHHPQTSTTSDILELTPFVPRTVEPSAMNSPPRDSPSYLLDGVGLL